MLSASVVVLGEGGGGKRVQDREHKVNNAGVVGAQTGWNTRAGEERGEREEEEEEQGVQE